MIKILIVEDTPVIRKHLEYILGSEPDMQVIGTACNGEEAIAFLKHQMPDVITMDIHMPRMDGFEATRRIMETTPVPIVIVSGSTDPSEVKITFKAVDAGAVGITLRPPGIGHPDHESEAKKLKEIVRLMSEVKVVRRRPGVNDANKQTVLHETASSNSVEIDSIKNDISIVALGASTGGPPVIKTILESLPEKFPAPVLIVQHIAQGFIRGFADWLDLSSKLTVRIGSHGERVMPGNAYLAPDNVQMGITPDGMLQMINYEPEHGLRPSVSYLFRSVASSFGRRAAGVLLTGMGTDGAEELLLIRNSGGITIAQDAASSIVHGMPGEAIRLNAAVYILSPDMIAGTLEKITSKYQGNSI